MANKRVKPSGYSGTPLAKKLGIKRSFRIRLVNQPDNYFNLFDDFPADAKVINDKKTKKNLIHYFATSTSLLRTDIPKLRKEIEQDGSIWISWPKKNARMETDLDENIVREIALKNKLVDVKVCAIDETWSGLKLVIRLKDRRT